MQGRNIFPVRVIEWDSQKARRVDDYLAGEEPLEIRSGRRSLGITLRTPGNDRELVAGFLYTEGIVTQLEQVTSIGTAKGPRGNMNGSENVVHVRLGRGAKLSELNLRRTFSAGSACGVCGKASIDQLRQRIARRPDPAARFDPELLCELPDKLREAQAIFGRTGGLHAAALFDASGQLLVVREDIGRHNAVDKVIGWALLEGRLPLAGGVLLVSGRGGFEIVQKALVAGVPILASVSAPSSFAVQLARELGLTLIGFLRGRRFITYTGEERLGISASAASSK